MDYLSIGIPARNEAPSLAKTVGFITKSDSWLATSPGDRELIICVNGSTDDTLKVARQLETEIPELKVIIQEEPGKNNAINRIVLESDPRADVIYFSDADVMMEPETIGKTVKALRSSEGIEFSAPIAVPMASLAPAEDRSILSSFYAEAIDFATRNGFQLLTGMGFAVNKRFLQEHPLPEDRLIVDDRFIVESYPNKIKMVYDARVIFQEPGLIDHLRQRARNKRQKRYMHAQLPALKEVALDVRQTRRAAFREIAHESSGKAFVGLALYGLMEGLAEVGSLIPKKETWPTIRSTKHRN